MLILFSVLSWLAPVLVQGQQIKYIVPAASPQSFDITSEGKAYGALRFTREVDFETTINNFIREKAFPAHKISALKDKLQSALLESGHYPYETVTLQLSGDRIVQVPLYKGDDLQLRAADLGENFKLQWPEIHNVYSGIATYLRSRGKAEGLYPRDPSAGPPAISGKFSTLKIYSPAEHQYFEQSSQLIVALLEELRLRTGKTINYEVVNKIVENEETALYLLFSTHEPRRMPKHYISYNLEQLCIGEEEDAHRGEWFYTKLRRAHEVWDYSKSNIECLRHKGGFTSLDRVKFFPQGHSSIFETGWWHLRVRKDYDFLFYGTLNPRRAEIMTPFNEAMTRAGKTVMVCNNNCWGPGDKFKGRIGLNIPYNTGNTTLEAHRIIPWIANRVWVVSLPGHDAWYNEMYSDVVTFAQPHELAAKALQVAEMDPTQFEVELDARYNRLVKKLGTFGLAKEAGVFDSLNKYF